MTAATTIRRPQALRRSEAVDSLLVAAIACLAEEGYAATSMTRIQQRAEINRGRCSHYFRTKNDLLLRAIERLFDQHVAEIRSTIHTLPREHTDRTRAAIAVLWEHWRSPLGTALIELRGVARVDPELRAVLAPREARTLAELEDVCRELFGPELSGQPGFADVLNLLFQAMNGALEGLHVASSARASDLPAFWARLLEPLFTSTQRAAGG